MRTGCTAGPTSPLPARWGQDGGMAAGDRGRPAGVALVFQTELAGGVRGVALCSARGRDVAGVLLGLGLVDGDLQVAPPGVRGPRDVACDGRAAHVVDVAAEPVEPIGGLLRTDGIDKPPKRVRHLRGPRHQRAHDAHAEPVAAGRGVLGLPVGHADLGQPRQTAVEVKRGRRLRFFPRRPVCVQRAVCLREVRAIPCADALQNTVVGPPRIAGVDNPLVDRVRYQLVCSVFRHVCPSFACL